MKVLILQSQPRATHLARSLVQIGLEPVVCPLLQIIPLAADSNISHCIQNLDLFDYIISVSAHASRIICNRVEDYWPQLPLHPRWFAVGPTSAAPLIALSSSVTTPESEYSSTGLLALHCLQKPAHRKILICSGRGGLNTLETELSKRAAIVTKLALYERQINTASQESISNIQTQDVAAVIISSTEILQALHACRPASEWHAVILAVSARIAALAKKIGFQHVYTCKNATSDNIIKELRQVLNL